MLSRYFNYRFQLAEGSWQRRDFAGRWWRIYENDPRWTPPLWSDWRSALEPDRTPHLARLDPLLLYGEALPRRTQPHSPQRSDLPTLSSALFEESIVAGLLLRDRRRRDGAAYAACLHVANDAETLSRFLMTAREFLQPAGVRQLILPTGISPYLGTGVLQDHFHRWPPLHSPYNPPYLPELIMEICRPLGRSLLYEVEVARLLEKERDGPATLHPFEPRRLAGDLLPLFQQTMPTWADFPPPDEPETVFLLKWISRWPLAGWLAEVEEQPVGFVLLQPDLAAILRRGRGGRQLWGRAWLAWRARQGVKAGRLLFGGVAPSQRRQGIGRQLWRRALRHSYESGWDRLSVGPFPSTALVNNFLEAQGVKPQRTYLLHRYEF
ncbi:MAG: GNAT family N-acetyltransferase [Caldilineaceae bacterium]|nr:GNAT family N-acetyltransferase [Caldilineaceae bacterium]